jgi:hypothetical protein
MFDESSSFVLSAGNIDLAVNHVVNQFENVMLFRTGASRNVEWNKQFRKIIDLEIDKIMDGNFTLEQYSKALKAVANGLNDAARQL